MAGLLRAACGVALAFTLAGPETPSAQARTKDSLAQAIETILRREVFGPAIVAIDIRDMETGRVLFEKNAGLNVKPASTMKLFTTAALLDAEGETPAASPTTVETAGRVDAFGRVLGDVYLIGRGDPNLSDRLEWRGGLKNPFDQLAGDLHEAGIRRIEGRVVGYDGLFTDEPIPDNWTADDLVWSYGATVSSLSAFDGTVRLRFEPGEREGEAARWSIEPATAYLEVVNQATTSKAGLKPDLSLSRALGSRRVVVSGTLPLDGAWSGAVAAPDPAFFATTLFAEALARQGVQIAGGVTTSRAPLPDVMNPLASVRGPGTAEQIRIVNKESQNLHAETLLRRLGLRVFQDASVESSLRARAQFLERMNVRATEAAMYDGSGLSRADLVSARAEADLLMAMARHPLARVFKDSLPIAGRDGTLKRRMIGTPAEGRVFAKTGSISHVNALAGYVDSSSGRHLAFSIVVNHHTRPSREATEAIDALCVLLAGLN